MRRSDFYLLRQALREGWPVHPANKRRIIDALETILDDPECDPRLKQAALRFLIDADRANVREVGKALAEMTARRSRPSPHRQAKTVITVLRAGHTANPRE